MAFDPKEFSLAGRTALIIGGAGGIGLALAQGLRAAGASVSVAGRSQGALDKAVAALGQGGDKPFGYSVDARSPERLRELAGTVEADHGPLHILINCQGTTAIKPAFEVTEEEYDAILDTNLKSVYFACMAFGAAMVERRDGVIINITSVSARNGWANAAAYCASKWGVSGLTQSLAAEWGNDGVRVNAIAPGFFLTDLNRDRMSPERKEQAVQRDAMKRMGQVDELAGAAVYLASDAARFVTGTELRVDGGWLASGI
jgi:NAD(P)-dependent dehydrogenase (short-subunit alcohol dehydrogenase family)